MASYTPNLNLIKPADADSYDVANDNGNMDKIDAALGSPSSASAVTGADAFSKINSLNSNIGTLSSLTTTAKDSAVAAINEINHKINISQYDALTLETGVSGTIYIGRLGKQRILTGYFKPDNAGTNILIATLASGDKPPVPIYFPCTGYTVGAQCEGSITTTGLVNANVPTGGNNNTVKVNVSWFIN